jgi:hypothetical protein
LTRRHHATDRTGFKNRAAAGGRRRPFASETHKPRRFSTNRAASTTARRSVSRVDRTWFVDAEASHEGGRRRRLQSRRRRRRQSGEQLQLKERRRECRATANITSSAKVWITLLCSLPVRWRALIGVLMKTARRKFSRWEGGRRRGRSKGKRTYLVPLAVSIDCRVSARVERVRLHGGNTEPPEPGSRIERRRWIRTIEGCQEPQSIRNK